MISSCAHNPNIKGNYHLKIYFANLKIIFCLVRCILHLKWTKITTNSELTRGFPFGEAWHFISKVVRDIATWLLIITVTLIYLGILNHVFNKCN